MNKNKSTKLRLKGKFAGKAKKFPLNSTLVFPFSTIGIKPFDIIFTQQKAFFCSYFVVVVFTRIKRNKDEF